MKNKILTQEINQLKKIKVRLDHRTTIVINNLKAFELWKKRYPDATIVA